MSLHAANHAKPGPNLTPSPLTRPTQFNEEFQTNFEQVSKSRQHSSQKPLCENAHAKKQAETACQRCYQSIQKEAGLDTLSLHRLAKMIKNLVMLQQHQDEMISQSASNYLSDLLDELKRLSKKRHTASTQKSAILKLIYIHHFSQAHQSKSEEVLLEWLLRAEGASQIHLGLMIQEYMGKNPSFNGQIETLLETATSRHIIARYGS